MVMSQTRYQRIRGNIYSMQCTVWSYEYEQFMSSHASKKKGEIGASLGIPISYVAKVLLCDLYSIPTPG